MAEDKSPNVKADAQTTPTVTKKVALTVDVPVVDEVVVCAVCGHENPPRAAMCAMCSNYLDNKGDLENVIC